MGSFGWSYRDRGLAWRRNAALDRIRRKNPHLSARDAHRRANQAARQI